MTEMEGILARANGAIASSARFPRESVLWKVTGGRTIQSQQLPTFLSTLSSKIVGDGDTINDVQIAVPILRSARPLGPPLLACFSEPRRHNLRATTALSQVIGKPIAHRSGESMA